MASLMMRVGSDIALLAPLAVRASTIFGGVVFLGMGTSEILRDGRGREN